ncbi:hypothetical protein Hanom_Chr16g01474671 [Helianthus anomalus]
MPTIADIVGDPARHQLQWKPKPTAQRPIVVKPLLAHDILSRTRLQPAEILYVSSPPPPNPPL